MGKTLKAGDTPELPDQEMLVDVEWGRQRFDVNPGTHTVIVDTKYIQQKAIGEFLQEVRARGGAGSRGQIGVREAVAIALGKFDVPMELIFAESENLRSEFDLDDTTLATIVRLRNERKTSAEPPA